MSSEKRLRECSVLIDDDPPAKKQQVKKQAVQAGLLQHLTEPGWKKWLSPEFEKTYFKNLEENLELRRKNEIVFPEESEYFAALNLCAFDDLKVVILGQDPCISF